MERGFYPGSVTRISLLVLLSICLFLAACGSERPATVSSPSFRAPVFDAAFRQQWDDGAAEQSSYETLRMRGGALRKATATAIVKRANYSEDERVPIENPKPTLPDLFPVIQMSWIERYTRGLENCAEMTTSALALAPVDGRVAGAETKVDFSLQSFDGQLFHQLLFDATGVRSHQYSYFESEGDEQITLPYPGDGISGDALWFWARHMAAPVLRPGEQRRVLILPSLRDARSQHRALTWRRATLTHSAAHQLVSGKQAEVFTVHTEDGLTETFDVEPQLPFGVLHWENSLGERADFISSSRVKSFTE